MTPPVFTPSDDQISAWLDGTLSPEETAALEAAMDADPALAERVLRWQENDAKLKAAIPEEPVSADLLARLGLQEPAPTSTVTNLADARAAKVEAEAAKASLLTRLRWPALGALAASVAAAVVLFTQSPGTAPAGLEGSQAFQVAMQSNPSTKASVLEDGRRAAPVLTIRAGDGRYCREFSVAGGSGDESGIACKSGERWTVEAQVKGTVGPDTSGEIRTAAGADGSALDATYDRLKASDPLPVEDEAWLIAGRWAGR